MKCEDLLKALNEYVDGEVDPSVCEGFQAHLEDCDPCQLVVDNIRKTISVFRDGVKVDLPEEFQTRLRSSLRESWKSHFSKPSGSN